MSNKVNTQTQNTEKGRAEARSRFHDLFNMVDVTIERINDILYLYYDTEDDYFSKDTSKKQQAECVLIDHQRYASYIKTANFSLSTALKELKEAIEMARDYYSEL